MDQELRVELREYAWNYFRIHADQRLRTFNFYLIICALISGGLGAIIKESTTVIVGIPLALIMTFLSFIFWKLDTRNKQLIRHGEEALICLENDACKETQDAIPSSLSIFCNEEKATNLLKGQSLVYTYSTCFHLVFLVFGVGGLVAAGWLFLI